MNIKVRCINSEWKVIEEREGKYVVLEECTSKYYAYERRKAYVPVRRQKKFEEIKTINDLIRYFHRINKLRFKDLSKIVGESVSNLKRIEYNDKKVDYRIFNRFKEIFGLEFTNHPLAVSFEEKILDSGIGFQSEIGKRVWLFRQTNGVSRPELARMLGLESQQNVYELEYRKTCFTFEQKRKLIEFGIDISDLCISGPMIEKYIFIKGMNVKKAAEELNETGSRLNSLISEQKSVILDVANEKKLRAAVDREIECAENENSYDPSNVLFRLRRIRRYALSKVSTLVGVDVMSLIAWERGIVVPTGEVLDLLEEVYKAKIFIGKGLNKASRIVQSKLSLVRKEKGMVLREIAAVMGSTFQNVNCQEKGGITSKVTAEKYAKVLGCSPEELIDFHFCDFELH